MLLSGKLVAVPAETVYGLAADATNPEACAAIFEAKGRPLFDPLIVHVSSVAQAKKLAVWSPLAERLAQAFWPGPLTLVLPRKPTVSDIVTSGLETVAVRMPAHPLFRKLLKSSGRPLAAPSANLFGYISPTSAEHVYEGLNGRIPAILDGGDCPMGVESTIVSLASLKKVQLLRPGAIPRGKLQAALGADIKITRKRAPVEARLRPASPGLLDRHYSPRTPTNLLAKFPPRMSSEDAWVHFRAPAQGPSHPKNHFVLAEDGNGEDAARSLYRLLREIDQRGFRSIQLERAPRNEPWSETLNDRMARAAAK